MRKVHIVHQKHIISSIVLFKWMPKNPGGGRAWACRDCRDTLCLSNKSELVPTSRDVVRGWAVCPVLMRTFINNSEAVFRNFDSRGYMLSCEKYEAHHIANIQQMHKNRCGTMETHSWTKNVKCFDSPLGSFTGEALQVRAYTLV